MSALASKLHLRRPILYGILALWLAFPFLTDKTYYIGLAVTLGIFAIVAIGYNLVAGNTGMFSFGHAAFMGIGAYTSAVLSMKLGISAWIALPLSAVVAGLAGYLVGLTSVRLGHLHLAMATIAFNIIFHNVVVNWSFTGGEAGLGPLPRPSLGSLVLNTDGKYFYLVWFLALALLLFTRNVVSGRIGRAMAAAKGDEVAAQVSGINVVTVKLNAFALSAFYAGIAGSLLGYYLAYVGPKPFGTDFSVLLFLMVLVGGFGSAWGSLFGAALLTLLPEFFRFLSSLAFIPYHVRLVFSDHTYNLLLFGVAMYVVVVYLPKGIMGISWRNLRLRKSQR